MSRVSIVLRPDFAGGGKGQALNASTDNTGHFQISGITPGRYRLEASRDGMVTQQYSPQADGPGEMLSLSAGQSITNLVFRLKSGGVISGRVTDENGDPLPYVEVQVLKISALHGVMNISRDDLPAETDDLGEYRAFDLSPGRYYVMATYSPQNLLQSEAAVKYLPSFYPGADDLAHASPLDVAAGQEVPGIDFLIAPSRVVSVNGNVVNVLTGRPARGAAISLQLLGASGADLAVSPLSGVASANGSFQIADVPPGSYSATAILDDQGRQFFALQNVEISPDGLADLSLALSPGIDLSGRIVYEGNGATPPSQTRVLFRPAGRFPAAPRTAPLNNDGSYTAKNLPPGVYQIDVRPLCSTCYLKSAGIAGVNVLRDGLDLTAGPPHGSLEIIVSALGGSLSGTVDAGGDQPLPGGKVVLVPDSSRRTDARLYKETVTDQYGGFKLLGIAPGDYTVFAWQADQDFAYQDPGFLKSIQGLGTDVHVDQNTAASAKITAISFPNQ